LLPTVTKDEYRPMERKLPEFKFWLSSTVSVLVVLASTATRATDVPVFWPILVLYFIVAVVIQCRLRVTHMIQHGYVPWEFGGKKQAILKQHQKPELGGGGGAPMTAAATAAGTAAGTNSLPAATTSFVVEQHPTVLPPTLKARQL
jgi:Rer1 family